MNSYRGTGDWTIDRRLVEMAEQGEEAIIAEGETPSGLPLLVVVVVGANVGLFKQYDGEVLPVFKKEKQS